MYNLHDIFYGNNFEGHLIWDFVVRDLIVKIQQGVLDASNILDQIFYVVTYLADNGWETFRSSRSQGKWGG